MILAKQKPFKAPEIDNEVVGFFDDKVIVADENNSLFVIDAPKEFFSLGEIVEDGLLVPVENFFSAAQLTDLSEMMI